MATMQDNDAYVELIQTGLYQPFYRVELLDFETEEFFEDITQYVRSGTVTVTLKNGGRWSCTLVLSNPDGILTPNRDRLWYAHKFRIVLGAIDNQTGNVFEYPQGVYCISQADLASHYSDGFVQVSASDKFALLDGTLAGTLTNIEIINNNSNIYDYIRTVLNTDLSNGSPQDPIDPNLSLDFNDSTNPYTIRHDRNSSQADVFLELAVINSADIFYSKSGELTYREDIDDSEKEPLFDFEKGDKLYKTANRSYPYSMVKNSVTVIGDVIEGNIVQATARNENPESDTNVNVIPENNFEVTESVYQTDAQALLYAQYLLNIKTRLQSSFDLDVLPVFHLDVDDVIRVTDSELNSDLEPMVINTINIGFGNSNQFLMTINATQISQMAVVS